MTRTRPTAVASVTRGDGPESGTLFAYRWVDLSTDRAFALDFDDYLDFLE